MACERYFALPQLMQSERLTDRGEMTNRCACKEMTR